MDTPYERQFLWKFVDLGQTHSVGYMGGTVNMNIHVDQRLEGLNRNVAAL
jgi:hypothetical protein